MPSLSIGDSGCRAAIGWKVRVAGIRINATADAQLGIALRGDNLFHRIAHSGRRSKAALEVRQLIVTRAPATQIEDGDLPSLDLAENLPNEAGAVTDPWEG